MFRACRSVTLLVRAAPAAPMARSLSQCRVVGQQPSAAVRRQINKALSHRGNIRLMSGKVESAASAEGEAAKSAATEESKEEQQSTIVKQRFDEDGYYEETEGKGSQVSRAAVVASAASLTQ